MLGRVAQPKGLSDLTSIEAPTMAEIERGRRWEWPQIAPSQAHAERGWHAHESRSRKLNHTTGSASSVLEHPRAKNQIRRQPPFLQPCRAQRTFEFSRTYSNRSCVKLLVTSDDRR
eukprot:scaffold6857_cov125-Isochrysis_galbana.AAC.5